MSIQASIATNRFGLGAKPNEIAHATLDPKNWLLAQLNTKPLLKFDESLPNSAKIGIKLAQLRKEKRALKKQSKTNLSKTQSQPAGKKYHRQIMRKLTTDTLKQSILSDNSLNWRLLDFFSNHFSVSTKSPIMAAIGPSLEREAIANNLLGKFEDMLLAVVKHPAMIIYLNNEKSFGENSRAGIKGKGLNENLVREILELHTMGINSGYSQTDVIELAKGITGWSVARPKKDKHSGFKFRAYGHEPGARKLLNKTYKNNGLGQGEAMLLDLARRPETAAHLCNKLVSHFIQDIPEPKLVDKMVKTWMKTQGDIKQVIISMINAPESWQNTPQKFKTPREHLVSTYRALGKNKFNDRSLYSSLFNLGQKPLNAGSPTGYSDFQQDWNGASALMTRIDWASKISAKFNGDTKSVMKSALGESISEHTKQMVTRAESKKQAATLLILSPEFIRR
jgi:uncharacterized protein (DUF1800 family)